MTQTPQWLFEDNTKKPFAGRFALQMKAKFEYDSKGAFAAGCPYWQ